MDTQTNIKYVVGIIIGVVVLIVVFIFINARMNEGPANGVDLTTFAQCLKTSGTIFYGAFWCPHCQATKRMFGSAEKYLPYHECSTPDTKGQLPDCTAKGVQSYPTWVFPDGTRLTGETTLQILSERSGCSLPAALIGSTTESVSTGASSQAISTSTQGPLSPAQ